MPKRNRREALPALLKRGARPRRYWYWYMSEASRSVQYEVARFDVYDGGMTDVGYAVTVVCMDEKSIQLLKELNAWQVLPPSDLRRPPRGRAPEVGRRRRGRTGGLTTPSTEFEVQKLSAGDAEAWGEVLKSTHGRGSLLMAPNGADTGKVLWKRFPDSPYAPYFMQAAAFGIWRTGGETRAQVVAAINEEIQAKDHTGILAEQIRLGRVLEAAERALADADVDSAIRAVENARGSLEQLSTNPSLHEHTRLKSREAINRLPSPESIRRQFGAAARR